MTSRSLTLGLLFSALLAVLIPYSDLVMRGTWIGLTAFPIASLFVLIFLAAAANPLLKRVGMGLSSAELLLIYSMTSAAAGIASFGLTGLLIPYLAGPSYFASPENHYKDLVLPYLPPWATPSSHSAVVALYQGLHKGSSIPWSVWVTPLAAWSAFALCAYTVFFSLSALVRRRWIEEERLVFPLVHLPIELARQEADSPSPLPPLLRNRILWTFFSVPFLIHTFNGLHFYWPILPLINVHRIPLDSLIAQRPWNALSPLWLRISFSVIGLAYLLPLDLSFSLWFFYFFFLVQQLIGSMRGAQMPAVQAYPVKAFVAHQMIGGILLFGVLGLVSMYRDSRRRTHAGYPDARATGDRSWQERGTPSGSGAMGKWPLVMGVLGMAGLSAFGGLCGAGVLKSVLLFGLYFVIHLVAVRLVCEGGMLYVQHPFRPINLMLAAVGTAGLGRRAIPSLVLFDHLLMLDNRSPLMPEIMQGLRIADDGKIRYRSMLLALAGSVVTAVLFSYFSYLRLMYRYGGLQLNTWFTTYYTNNLYCGWTSSLMGAGEPASPTTWVGVGAGAATMALMLFMHRNFLWWPFHPIGYLMGASWPMINFWFPIFLGWLIKGAILRYGGAKVYRQLMPGFLGLILAEFFSAGLWVIIDLFTGVRGHEIFSF